MYDENGNLIEEIKEENNVANVVEGGFESVPAVTDLEGRPETEASVGRRRRPRKRRRSKIQSKDTADIKIMHSNCDGYTSKKQSIEDIVKEKRPDLLLLNETSLKGKRKVRIKDYFSYCRNRVKAKGGVA